MQSPGGTLGLDGKKHKSRKKLFKKVSSGGVFSHKIYHECRELGIKADSAVCAKKEATRSKSSHDLNAFEVRDFIRSLFADDIAISKMIETRNKGFIRHCFIVNIGDDGEDLFACPSLELGEPMIVRASRKASVLGSCNPPALWHRLLTFASPAPPQKPAAAEHQSADNETAMSKSATLKRPREEWGTEALSPYVLSASMLVGWGFPVPCEEQLENRKARVARSEDINHDVTVSGEVTGLPTLPTLEESMALLGHLPKICLAEGYETTKSACYYQTVQGVTPSLFETVALDCEMCDTKNGLELTRCSLIDGLTGRVILDTLVLPHDPITDYRSAYSGITAALLAPVTTRLEQIQAFFIKFISASTIIIGHSLENDMKAIRIVHEQFVDTAHIYPHPRGFPYRHKLRHLAREYLHWNIQSAAGGSAGHDSIIDAQTALELVKMKVKRGPLFGVDNGAGRHYRPSMLSIILADRNSSTDSPQPPEGGRPCTFDAVKASMIWVAGCEAEDDIKAVASAPNGIAADLLMSTSLDQAVQKLSCVFRSALRQRFEPSNRNDKKQYLCFADVSGQSIGSQNVMLAINENIKKCLLSVSSSSTPEGVDEVDAGISNNGDVAAEKHAAEHVLLIVVQQRPTRPVIERLQLRRACSVPKATRIWTREMEDELKQMNHTVNCGKIYMKVV